MPLIAVLTRPDTSQDANRLRLPITNGSDPWEMEFDEWLDSFPQHPVLGEQALKREAWYHDRW